MSWTCIWIFGLAPRSQPHNWQDPLANNLQLLGVESPLRPPAIKNKSGLKAKTSSTPPFESVSISTNRTSNKASNDALKQTTPASFPWLFECQDLCENTDCLMRSVQNEYRVSAKFEKNWLWRVNAVTYQLAGDFVGNCNTLHVFIKLLNDTLTLFRCKWCAQIKSDAKIKTAVITHIFNI